MSPKEGSGSANELESDDDDSNKALILAICVSAGVVSLLLIIAISLCIRLLRQNVRRANLADPSDSVEGVFAEKAPHYPRRRIRKLISACICTYQSSLGETHVLTSPSKHRLEQVMYSTSGNNRSLSLLESI